MSDELPTGKASVEESLGGYERRPETPAPAEPKTYGGGIDEVARAANDLTRDAGGSDEKSIVEVRYADKPDAKLYVSAEQAGKDLSDWHKAEEKAFVDVAGSQLASEIDGLRAQAWGLQPPAPSDATPDQQTQPEAPQTQPEASEPPPSGIDPDVAAALQNPKVRAAVEAPIRQAIEVSQAYSAAAEHNAALLAASLFVSFPELKGVAAKDIGVAIELLSKQDPVKGAAIAAHVNGVVGLHNANAEYKAQQAAQQRQQVNQWIESQDAAFDNAIAKTETPETIKRVKSELLNVAKEAYGLSSRDIQQAFAANPVLHSAPFQRLVFDAIKYQLASKSATANPASRGNVPPVQRPGVPLEPGERAAVSTSDLRDKFRGARGNEQLRLGVKLMQAQRGR